MRLPGSVGGLLALAVARRQSTALHRGGPTGRVEVLSMLAVDLLLAIAHHLLMFALLAVLVVEMTLTRPGLDPRRLDRLGGLDFAYGATAGLLLAVGFARVFFGLKGPEYYFANVFFWLKIAAFLLVGMLSVAPTRRILAWRSRARTEPGYLPAAEEIATVRRYMHAEAMVFIVIPIFAALMARYSG
jgi:putative membrane protein